jgi:hypothetical protein
MKADTAMRAEMKLALSAPGRVQTKRTGYRKAEVGGLVPDGPTANDR